MTEFTLAANNFDELRTQFGALGKGPLARDRRSHDDKEIYCLRRYLFTLAAEGLLEFPLSLQKSEAPDFVLKSVVEFGLEITEATDARDQREISLGARRSAPWFEGQFGGRGRGGFVGDAPQELWKSYIETAVMRKAKKSYHTTSTRLLIYSNSNAGGWIDAKAAQALLKPEFCRCLLGVAQARFSELSIIKGDKLLHDITASQGNFEVRF